jgi:hypothetical protein
MSNTYFRVTADGFSALSSDAGESMDDIAILRRNPKIAAQHLQHHS